VLPAVVVAMRIVEAVNDELYSFILCREKPYSLDVSSEHAGQVSLPTFDQL
jgi:hypothetical protein